MGLDLTKISDDFYVSCTGECSGFLELTALTSLESIGSKQGTPIVLSSAWRSPA